MIKNTVIALVAAASLAGLAAPAFAETDTSIGLDDFATEQQDLSDYETATQLILVRLQEKGINATAVEDWGGLIRAFVTQEDGRQVMQLFTPDTLEPVAL